MSWLDRAADWLQGMTPLMSQRLSPLRHDRPSPVEFCAADFSEGSEHRARGASANTGRRALAEVRPPTHVREPCVWAADPRGG